MKNIITLLCAFLMSSQSNISAELADISIKNAVLIDYETTYEYAYMLEESTNLTTWNRSWINWDTGYYTGYTNQYFSEVKNPHTFYRIQKTLRPEVTTSVPANGSVNISSTTTNLLVHFPEDMKYGSAGWGYVPGTEYLPNSTTRWLDARTWELVIGPLEKHTLYGVELHGGFFSSDGVPLLPSTIQFTTGE